ncbi:MAG: sigma-70 family RNA polymerase sigma factor [Dehalococcoidia bacterium]|nr:MAG: sigma-70 family RNA polymerase sigma factor [Dehalococcoidia bacterium]
MDKNETAKQFTEVAKIKAALWYKKTPRFIRIDYEELESAALYGLAVALNSYSDEKNVKINTWVEQKMTFAIMDYLREIGSRNKSKKRDAKKHVYNVDLDSVVDYLIIDDNSGNVEELFEYLTKDLTDTQRKVMRWRFIDGLTYEEMMPHHGKSKNWPSKFYLEAMEHLKNNFDVKELFAEYV